MFTENSNSIICIGKGRLFEEVLHQLKFPAQKQWEYLFSRKRPFQGLHCGHLLKYSEFADEQAVGSEIL